ncbi:DMT family transporter [Lipingzhangella sp. LS1_29]|uniref:DMT family transporter n=1 Tax=Lipingzhangella rawalii TaxID=2055835 RepID=A0ABU2H2U9_9ACTN|nr:DMT family transporter [Lipingzhangella rawalii]MDS1269616.1 DMT family transporter [Lipingzhangella rawalii]
MSKATLYFLGVACVGGYILLASSQSVALNTWLATTNVFLVVGLSFSIVTVCFVVISLALTGFGPYRAVFRRPGLVVGLNVTSVFNWLFYFLAVKYLEPAVAVTLTQGIGPLSMTAYCLVRGFPVSRVTRSCHGVILVVASVMCVYVVSEQVTHGPYGRPELAMAVAIGIVCSISITATVLLSKAFAEENVPSSFVLSVRFPLLVATCMAVLPTQSDVTLDTRSILIVLAVALLGIATATYLLQRGIEMAPSLAVSTCLALSPIVVFVIDVLRPGFTPDPAVFGIIALIVVVSLVSIIYDGLRLRADRTGPVDPTEEDRTDISRTPTPGRD